MSVYIKGLDLLNLSNEELEDLRARRSQRIIRIRNSNRPCVELNLDAAILSLRMVIGAQIAKQHSLCPPFREGEKVACIYPAKPKGCPYATRSVCPGETRMVRDCMYDADYGWLICFNGFSDFERYDADDFAELQI